MLNEGFSAIENQQSRLIRRFVELRRPPLRL
jgi:hypothetical protein